MGAGLLGGFWAAVLDFLVESGLRNMIFGWIFVVVGLGFSLHLSGETMDSDRGSWFSNGFLSGGQDVQMDSSRGKTFS